MNEAIVGAFGYQRNPHGKTEPLNHRPELYKTRAMLTGDYAGEEGSEDKAVVDALYARKDTSVLLDGVERLAHVLEGSELIPLWDLPSARVRAWREQENPDFDEIRIYAYGLLEKLKEACQWIH